MRSWAELRQEGRQSVARALGDLFRRFQDMANDQYAQRGWKGLTLSHVQFLSEIEEGGTSVSEVAKALGTTKQYVGKLARELSAKGLLTLGPGPGDRRVVLLSPTELGGRFLDDACVVRSQIETELFRTLEGDQRQAFLQTVDTLLR